MTYALAKKLKYAGFPQKSSQPEDCLEGDFDCTDCGSPPKICETCSGLTGKCQNCLKLIEVNE